MSTSERVALGAVLALLMGSASGIGCEILVRVPDDQVPSPATGFDADAASPADAGVSPPDSDGNGDSVSDGDGDAPPPDASEDGQSADTAQAFDVVDDGMDQADEATDGLSAN